MHTRWLATALSVALSIYICCAGSAAFAAPRSGIVAKPDLVTSAGIGDIAAAYTATALGAWDLPLPTLSSGGSYALWLPSGSRHETEMETSTGTRTDLPDNFACSGSGGGNHPRAINDSGDVVGNSIVGGVNTPEIVHSDASVTTLTNAATTYDYRLGTSGLCGINNDGTVIGASSANCGLTDSRTNSHSLFHNCSIAVESAANGAITPTGVPGSYCVESNPNVSYFCPATQAADINDSGLIVGFGPGQQDGSAPDGVYTWTSGAPAQVESGTDSGVALNNSGAIIFTQSSPNPGVYFDDGSGPVLTGLDQGFAVNSSGVVVGVRTGTGGGSTQLVASAWTAAGGLVDIGPLVTNLSPGSFNMIFSIGDNGNMIVGQSSGTQAYLLTPSQTSRYTLSGRVTDPSSAPLSGVTITIAPDSGPSTILSTGTDGTYSAQLTAGSYTVTPSLTGQQFHPTSRTVDLTSSDATADFVEAGALRVTGVSPSAGPIIGGTSITVTGNGFGNPGDSDTVNLIPNGGGTPIPATNVTVVDDGTITAVTGDASGDVGSGVGTLGTDVVVTAGGDTSAVNPADGFGYGVPIVTAVSPAAIDVGDQWKKITLTGSGFQGATTVSFVNEQNHGFHISAPWFKVSPDGTQITFLFPSNLKSILESGLGSQPQYVLDAIVSVGSVVGQRNAPADQLTIGGPVVTSVSPSTVDVGARNTTLTITGTGFTGATKVWFGDQNFGFYVPAAFFSVNADGTQITVRRDVEFAPHLYRVFGNSDRYDVDVHVQVGSIVSATDAEDLVIFNAPKANRVSQSGSDIGDQTLSVTIEGSSFTGATAISFADSHDQGFSVYAAHFTINADGTRITAELSANLPTLLHYSIGDQYQYVLKVHVSVDKIQSFAGLDDIVILHGPEVDAVTPTGADIGAKGTTFTIYGAGFTGATRVSLYDDASGHQIWISAPDIKVNADGTEITFPRPINLVTLLHLTFGDKYVYYFPSPCQCRPAGEYPSGSE